MLLCSTTKAVCEAHLKRHSDHPLTGKNWLAMCEHYNDKLHKLNMVSMGYKRDAEITLELISPKSL